MAKAQKFGTFAGVFTPSVLTILGVIMYLRLGWVVGQTGLFYAIGIILVAHIISITTGLSVSSVATDKKVKAGGLYYMLSRSLGLPIGGSIGIALFVGTALSISMYIVGFSDSFNFTVGISNNTMTDTQLINNVRLIGTITIVTLTAIALISTSFALKTQFYIMAAIFISLISIVVGGIFTAHEFQALTPHLSQFTINDAPDVSLGVVFGIFFPAVTGFTAGVALSGDLKDPKSSIPIGTMASIAVGLLVYIGLAIFLAFYVDDKALRADYNILAKIAFFAEYGAPSLLAGIWGATLSSALGGILGGPRILQAMSIDNVTPKIFAKGVGSSNEPRNALIATFIIAETGILIGKLDSIIPIVTVFYLIAYGFINLTAALESWSGSDFRPQFKIPKYISIIGALASFIMVFQQDSLTMVLLALAIVGGLFFYLTRKQISIGFSDIWQGVWAEIARTALTRITSKPTDQKNWRPNILLFSGGSQKRPYLVEFGKNLIGQLGVISNFNLIEDTKGIGLVKAEDGQSENKTSPNYKGMFTREYYVEDVYDGIDSLASTYGFSGFEPNTVLLGWSRYANVPFKFSRLIGRFNQLDYNVLIMDYNSQMGYGNQNAIDIWFRGKGRNLSFALTMVRFLISGNDWLNAHVRILMYLDRSSINTSELYKSLEAVLEEMRLQTEIKVVDSTRSNYSFFDAVREESQNTSLVLLGLPEPQKGKEMEFYSSTNALCQITNTTVLLYKASTNFKEVDVGLENLESITAAPTSQSVTSKEITSPETLAPTEELKLLVLPSHEAAKAPLNATYQKLEEIIFEYYREHLRPVITKNTTLIEQIQAIILLEKEKFERNASAETQGKIEEPFNTEKTLEKLIQIISSYQKEEVSSQQTLLLHGNEKIIEAISSLIKNTPTQIPLTFNSKTLKEKQNYEKLIQNFSFTQVNFNSVISNQLKYDVPLRKILRFYITYHGQQALDTLLNYLGNDLIAFQQDLKNLLLLIYKNFKKIELSEDQTNMTSLFDEVVEFINQIISKNQQKNEEYKSVLIDTNHKYLQQLSDLVENLEVRIFLKENKLKSTKTTTSFKDDILEMPENWSNYQQLLLNYSTLDLSLKIIQKSIEKNIDVLIEEIKESIRANFITILNELVQILEEFKGAVSAGEREKLTEEVLLKFQGVGYGTEIPTSLESFLSRLRSSYLSLSQKQSFTTSEEAFESNIQQFENLDIIEVDLQKTVQFILQTHLIEPITQQINELERKIEETLVVTKDVARIVGFSLENLPKNISNASEETIEDIQGLLDSENTQLQKAKEDLIETQTTKLKALTSEGANIQEKLTPFLVLKSAQKLDTYIRSQNRNKAVSRLTNTTNSIKKASQKLATQLIYRKSRGVLIAKELQNVSIINSSPIEHFFTLTEKLQPKSSVIKSLPLYYKQLFLGSHTVGVELWQGRETQLKEVEETVQRYAQYRSGGILVTGDRGMGKNFLSEYIANHFPNHQKIFRINPPFRGSISSRIFKSAISKATGFSGGLHAVFNQIPSESIFIFNDLELWWERSPEGYEILEEITQLIDEYAHQFTFIFNIGEHSFHLINQIKKLENSFLKVIRCQPFNAEELQQAILIRHQSSRLKFKYKGIDEGQISSWQKAKLFEKFFNASQGNIGTALQTWVSSIQNIDHNALLFQIEKPFIPSTDIFHSLRTEWVILLIQIILHKRLTQKKLYKMLDLEEKAFYNHIQSLKRCGLLVEENGTLNINRYVYPYIIRAFKEKEVL